MSRKITFEQACQQYQQRYTMEHVPNWAFRTHNGKFYAPQYATDREWYDSTIFPREEGHHGFGTDCYSTKASWPMGLWLERPYRGTRGYVAPDDTSLPLDVRQALVISRARDDCRVLPA